MHFKYAAIMNIVYITLMFGIGLPILYPLAVLALVILYVSEKLMLYYSYQGPPKYDEKLSQNVITHLKVAPLVMLLFGYWMLSSH